MNSGATLLGNAFNALGYAGNHGGDTLQINEGGTLSVGAGQVLSMPYNLNVVGGTVTSVDGGDPTYGTYYFGPGTQTFTSASDGTTYVSRPEYQLAHCGHV